MSAELCTLLRALLEDESRREALTHDQERTLVSSLRAIVGDVARPQPAPAVLAAPRAEDDLLTVNEAAVLLRVSPRWLYRHAKTLPFARKLSRKVLRFSRAGIARWLATKRP